MVFGLAACGKEEIKKPTDSKIENTETPKTENDENLTQEPNTSEPETEIETETEENKFTETDFRFGKKDVIYDFNTIPSDFWTAQNDDDEEKTNAEHLITQIDCVDFNTYMNGLPVYDYKLVFSGESYITRMSSYYSGLSKDYYFSIQPNEFIFNDDNIRELEDVLFTGYFVTTDLECSPIIVRGENLNKKPKEEITKGFEFLKELNGYEVYIKDLYADEENKSAVSEILLFKQLSDTDSIKITTEEVPFLEVSNLDKLLEGLTSYITLVDDSEYQVKYPEDIVYTGNKIFDLGDITLDFTNATFYDISPVCYFRFVYNVEKVESGKTERVTFLIEESRENLEEFTSDYDGIELKDVEEYKNIKMKKTYINNEFYGILFEVNDFTYHINLDPDDITEEEFFTILKEIIK